MMNILHLEVRAVQAPATVGYLFCRHVSFSQRAMSALMPPLPNATCTVARSLSTVPHHHSVPRTTSALVLRRHLCPISILASLTFYVDY
jgi:hypothetical protein